MRRTPLTAHAAFEGHPEPVLIWDRRTFVILDANAAAVRKYGYKRRQLLGKSIYDIRPAEEITRVRRRLARRAAPLKDAVFLHRKKGGAVFEAQVANHQLTYDGRKAVMAIVRDVTEKNKIERDRRDNEERLRLMIGAVKEYAIFMLDRDGVVVSWNEGARRLKGYRASEIIGRHFSVFYPPAETRRGLPQRLLRRALLHGSVEDRGLRVRKDGTRFHADVVITPIRDKAGRLRGFVKVTRDTTERDKAESRVSASRSIVRAEEAERRRVARELHDGVNQLLVAAKFRVQDAEERLAAGEPVGAAVVESRKILESAINEIRRISRNLRPAALDDLGLKAALRGACADFRLAGGLSVRLDARRLPDSLPEETELTLYRIVQEALSNASRHASARRVAVVAARRGRSIYLSVSDDGMGFKPGGAGSGLTNIRERVQFLGGRCEFRVAKGGGAKVIVILPENR